MGDFADLTVHRLGCPNHLGAEGLADALVAQADAEDRQPPGGLFHHLEADAGAVGVAGTGGNDDPLGAQAQRLVGADGVVAAHLDLRPQLAQVMAQVVGKAVVVV